MIDYPEDQQLREQASRHDLQAPMLIRDIVWSAPVLVDTVICRIFLAEP